MLIIGSYIYVCFSLINVFVVIRGIVVFCEWYIWNFILCFDYDMIGVSLNWWYYIIFIICRGCVFIFKVL